MALESKYPQGAEKMIIQSATGRKMPPGKLPSDVGCVVMNVASIAFVGRFVATGKPLVSRSMTIDGSAIKNPKNIRVPIGTMMDYIIDYCGGFTEEPEKIVCGGPMMGAAITDINYPILKGNNALLEPSAHNIHRQQQHNSAKDRYQQAVEIKSRYCAQTQRHRDISANHRAQRTYQSILPPGSRTATENHARDIPRCCAQNQPQNPIDHHFRLPSLSRYAATSIMCILMPEVK